MALLTWSGAPSSSQDDKLSVSAYADRVETLRRFFRHHRAYAAWLIAAALFMKVVVPAGYMPVVSSGSIVLELCSGVGPEKMAMAMPGMAAHHGKTDHSSKDDMPCGFSGHAPASMAATDPILLVLAIAFIVATLFRMPVSWPVRRASFLRPPLRGPPTIG